MDDRLRNVPPPTYQRDKDKLLGSLDKSYKQMLLYVVNELSKGVSEQSLIREIEIMKQVNIRIAQLDADMAKGLDTLIRRAFQEGQAYHLLAIGEADTWKDAISKASFNRVQRGKVEALIADTYRDILQATANTAIGVKFAVRDTVAKVAQYHSLRNNHYDEQAKDLFKQLSKQGLSENIQKKGFVGITDRAGRRWDLKVYSNMVIKTKTNQAYTEGIIHEAQETGIDLATISDHNADDACSKWEGVIISMTGATAGFPTYAQARATNQIFHPNCEHTIHPVRNLKLMNNLDLIKAKRKAKALGLERPVNPVIVPPIVVPPTAPPPPPEEFIEEFIDFDEDILTHDNIKIVRDYSTQVNKKIKKENADKVYNMLDNAPTAYKKVWEQYQDKIIYKRNGGTNAYYSPSEKGVYMSWDIVSAGKSYQKPLQVFFHEFAHNIDAEANVKLGTGTTRRGISHTYKNQKFEKALREDFKDVLEQTRAKVIADIERKIATESYEELGVQKLLDDDQLYDYAFKQKQFTVEDLKKNITDAHLYKAIQTEIRALPLIELGNVSDIMGGLSGLKVNGGLGHSAKYWTREDTVSSEAFAEFYDSMVANQESFNHMKKYFPQGLAVFEEILEFIVQGG